MKYWSLAGVAGTTGTRYYTAAFLLEGIRATYTALSCPPNQFAHTFRHLAAQPHTRGISVTMPHKQAVLGLADHLAPSAVQCGAANTVVVDGNTTIAHNTDLGGVRWVIAQLPPDAAIAVLGDGAMAQIFVRELQAAKYPHVDTISRRLGNWPPRIAAEIIVNCTPITQPPLVSDRCREYYDLQMDPAAARHLPPTVRYTGGRQFYHQVFQEQFALYTGRTLTPHRLQEVAQQCQ